MNSAPRNVLSDPALPSFLEQLAMGNLAWQLIYPFPAVNDATTTAGDDAVAELTELLTRQVDPDALDRSRELPPGLLEQLAKDGWLALGVPSEAGGRGLSAANVFRVVQAAASWSVPVAQVLAVEAAIGLSALLPAIPDGPLRAELLDKIAAGSLSASADTEPSGAANQSRDTTAVPIEDGAAYLLNGEKIHIGNGSIAQTFIVSATVPGPDGRGSRRLFVVDADSPGLRVRGEHEFMGLHGFPNAALSFTDVRVPASRLIEESSDPGVRLTANLLLLVVTGRMYLIAAPSLALARLASQWSRQFVADRTIDGRPLADYELIAQLVAQNLADTFAIDTVASWCLAEEGAPVNRLPELMAAKNISSVHCWRVLDRTMSLLAGEGFETAASKQNRGAAPLPLERAFRDARGLRISGGVDFLLDYWGSTMFTLSHYYPADHGTVEPDLSWCAEAPLSARNRQHLAEFVRQAGRFGRTLHQLTSAASRAELAERQAELRLLNQILEELATGALTLARAATAADQPDGSEFGELADIACTEARNRLAGYWAAWQALGEDDGPDYRGATRTWLDGSGFAVLGADLAHDPTVGLPR